MQLSIAGATLAGLLQSCASSPRPCVGLLFGHVTTAVSLHAQDTADDVRVTQVVGHITSTCACVGTHAFHNSTGDISEEQLAVLLSTCCCCGPDKGATTTTTTSSSSSSNYSTKQLLGWFSYRPHTPSIPSMLEAAVCQKLQAVLSSSSSDGGSASQAKQQSSLQPQPLVFGLLTSHLEHNGATVSLQHRFFAYQDNSSSGWQQQGYSSGMSISSGGSSRSRPHMPPQHPNLQPLELQVFNLGQPAMQRQGVDATAAVGASSSPGFFSSASPAAAGGAAAGSINTHNSSSSSRLGIQQLSALAAALDEEGSTTSSSSTSTSSIQKLLAAAQAVAAAGGPLSVVVGLYSSLLEELQVAAAAVSEQQDTLVALQEENARLRAAVATGGGGVGSGGGCVVAAAKDVL